MSQHRYTHRFSWVQVDCCTSGKRNCKVW